MKAAGAPAGEGDGPRDGPAAGQAPTQPQQCELLHLDIGPVNLDLLGLVFTTQPIGIDLSGESGGVLGQLICLILETVGNVRGVQT